MSKYKNRKYEVDGITFDSTGEANRYCELKLLEKVGLISDLKLQPRFLLQPAFTYNKSKFRKIEYVADFSYWDIENQKWMVEDFKGFKTEVYKIKKKMLLFHHPHINFVETY